MYSLLFHSCALCFEFLFERGAFGGEFQRDGSKTAIILHSAFHFFSSKRSYLMANDCKYFYEAIDLSQAFGSSTRCSELIGVYLPRTVIKMFLIEQMSRFYKEMNVKYSTCAS